MTFYQSLLEKISYLEKLVKDREFRDSSIPWFIDLSQKSKDGKLISKPWFIIAEEIPDKLMLSFWKIVLYFTRIWMIAGGAPSSNFNVFTQAGKEGVYICNYNYCYYKGFHKKTKWKFITALIVSTTIVSLIVALVFPGKPYSKAATVSWLQSSWAGGASALKANDLSNRTNWTKYADDPAADANITIGATVALSPIADSETETADADFNGKSVVDTLDTDFNQGDYGTPATTLSDGAGGVILIMPPGAPTGLSATAGNAQVTLNWIAPSSNGGSAITSYKVYRGTTSGGESLLSSGSCSGLGNVLTCTNTSLSNGTTYYYKVSAVNVIGEGSQSAEANATPQCTVVIGTQTWMCYNMNVGTLVAGSGNQGTSCSSIQKYCYSDTEANCTTGGGLYQWNQAMCGSTTAGAQGICPSDFHIPTDAEQYTLENYLKNGANSCVSTRSGQDCDPAGTKLKVGGTSGFEGILAGSRSTGSFNNQGAFAYFWSSSENGNNAWDRHIGSGYSTVFRFAYDKTALGLSVRCIKD